MYLIITENFEVKQKAELTKEDYEAIEGGYINVFFNQNKMYYEINSQLEFTLIEEVDK